MVIENITRHLEDGMQPIEAALVRRQGDRLHRALDERVAVAVFIPILLMGGIVGRLFREFAVTLSVAIAVSMVVSLTTTPMMCAHGCCSREKRQRAWPSRIAASERAFDGCSRLRRSARPGCCGIGRSRSSLLLATIALNVYALHRHSEGLLSRSRTPGMLGGHRAGAAGHLVSRAVRDDDRLRRNDRLTDPAIDTVVAFTGGGGTGANSARMFISLKPLAVRKVHADEVIARLRRRSSRAMPRRAACSSRPCRTSASAAAAATRSISTRCRPTISPS